MTDRLANSKRYYKKHLKRERKRRYDYYSKHKHEWAKYHLNLYGIGIADYNKLLTEQQGVCKICKQKCSSGKMLCVDHDHLTGKIRGLLCSKCNKGLGLFNDNVFLLKEALLYLEG